MFLRSQPIGVGLSRPEKADLWSRNLLEAGVDFDKFMDIFLNDLFPNLQNNELHFAGESFGGKYVPVYASLMRRKLDSIILVDPLVDFSSSALGIFDHFCPSGDRRTESHSRYFNTTTCEEMQEPAQRCQRMGSLCQASYDPFHCLRALKECLEIRDFYFREVKPGGRHPQDDRRTCSALPRCGDPGMQIQALRRGVLLIFPSETLTLFFRYFARRGGSHGLLESPPSSARLGLRE